jgi:outer membrane beta-barrel protein
MGKTVTMTAMRLFVLCAALLAGFALAPVAPRAHAQDLQVEGPLAGAPAVIGLRIYREMRFQAQLQGTMTLNDEFSRSILVGGQLMFHPTDWLGIGVWGGFGLVNIDTDLTDQVSERGQTNEVNVLSLPRPGGFTDQIGRIKWMAAPQIQFIPLRGKLGIFEKLFIDTDFYLLGGVGLVGIEERAEVNSDFFGTCRNRGELGAQIQCLEPTQSERESRMAIAPTFGAGLSLYMGNWAAMTFEWRAMPFAWNTSGTDESGNSRGDFPDDQINSDDQLAHFNHMISLGFAFYLPTEPGLSHMDEDE